MKVALCISGLPREFKRAYPSLKKHLIDVVNPDIFVYTWEALNQPHFEIEGAIRYPDEGSLKEFRELYQPKAFVSEVFDAQRELSFYDEKYEVNRHPHASIKRLRAMYYTIFMCHTLAKTYGNYDVFIKGRSDLELSNTFNIEELEKAKNNRTLFSDVIRTDGMVSDILFFGNREVMDITCNLYNEIDKYNDQKIQFNTEVFLPHHLKENKIAALQHAVGQVSVVRPPQAKW